jgi:hypothetical protein
MATPVVSDRDPLVNATEVVKNKPIAFSVIDTVAGVNLDSVQIFINGVLIYSVQQIRASGWGVTAVAIVDGFRITVTPIRRFRYYRNEESITVRLIAEDILSNALDTNWSFSTIRNLNRRVYSMIVRSIRQIDQEN